MEAEAINFQFPTILTPEEETFLIEEIGKSMEALYNENEDNEE